MSRTAKFPPGLWSPALVGIVLLAGLTLSVVAAEKDATSENNPRLAEWLKKYPKADANGDGVLTVPEAQAYREQLNRRRAEQSKKPKPPSITPTVADARYGDHPRNFVDFYRAKAAGPTPVLIYFHGGGFVGGDKRVAAKNNLVRGCLGSGISVVSGNYRFITGPEGEPFPGPMHDGARVVQFVRSKAGEWSLDPKRVALAGGSAGACMSMWIAMHDDLADPDSEAPIARLSTKVSCVVAYGGQSCLDPKWILKNIGGNPSIHPSLKPFYGVGSQGELETPKVQALMREASAINHASKDDPPMYLSYGTPLTGTPLPPETSIGTSIHHAMFGKLVKDKYRELGIVCQLRYAGHAPEQDELAFLKEHFRMEQ